MPSFRPPLGLVRQTWRDSRQRSQGTSSWAREVPSVALPGVLPSPEECLEEVLRDSPGAASTSWLGAPLEMGSTEARSQHLPETRRAPWEGEVAVSSSLEAAVPPDPVAMCLLLQARGPGNRLPAASTSKREPPALRDKQPVTFPFVAGAQAIKLADLAAMSPCWVAQRLLERRVGRFRSYRAAQLRSTARAAR